MRHPISDFLTALILIVLGTSACDPLSNLFEPVEPAVMYEANPVVPAPAPDGAIRVMTWNIKFGGGRLDFFFDCHGDFHNMSSGQVYTHLDGLVNRINAENPDILLLQEADVDSRRSAYIDQVQYILDNTSLNYGAYASQWRVQFIPIEELGRMDSGNAVLSKWPIPKALRYSLANRTDMSDIEIQYYLKRNMLEAVIDVPGFGEIYVVNIHAAAYSTDGTKKKHVDTFKAHIDALDTEGRVFIAGGDLNTLPPYSAQWSDYEDSVCTDADFQGDDHIEEKEWLTPFYERYDEVIPLEDYTADNAPYFTHSTSADVFWNRTLDYIFSNQPVEGGEVLQDTMVLSDHAPKIAAFELETVL